MRKRYLFAAVLAVLTSVSVTAGTSSATAPTWCTDKSQAAVIGTSADTGYGTTGYPGTAQTFQRTVYGWATRFIDNLNASWGTSTANYAHNGAMAADYLPGGRWPDQVNAVADLGTRGANLVIVDLGGNEYWSQRNPSTFRTEIRQLLSNIRAARPQAVILLSIYPEIKWQQSSDSGNLPLRYTYNQYATEVYQAAVDFGSPLIDMRQYAPSATSTNPTQPSVYLPDGIHLNDAGNLAEYGAFWGQIVGWNAMGC
jgi:lysophospholipase L1-like esterase